jgi:hypothetical protein
MPHHLCNLETDVFIAETIALLFALNMSYHIHAHILGLWDVRGHESYKRLFNI